MKNKRVHKSIVVLIAIASCFIMVLSVASLNLSTMFSIVYSEVSNSSMVCERKLARQEKLSEYQNKYVKENVSKIKFVKDNLSSIQGDIQAWFDQESNTEINDLNININDSLKEGFDEDTHFILLDSDNNVVASSSNLSNQTLTLKFNSILSDHFLSNQWQDTDSGFMRIDDKICFALFNPINDEYSLITYVNFTEFLAALGKLLIAPLLMLVATILVLLFCVLKMTKESHLDRIKPVELPRLKNKFINWFAFSRVFAVTAIAFIVVVLFIGYSTVIGIYTEQNIIAISRAELLEDNIKVSNQEKAAIMKQHDSMMFAEGQVIAQLIDSGEEWRSRSGLSEIATNFNLEEISIYNNRGIIESSNCNYVGYGLTRNTDDVRSAAWKVLNTDNSKISVAYEDESNRVMTAVRRLDNPGIVLLISKEPEYSEIMRNYSESRIIQGTDFGTATKFFMFDFDSDTLFYIKPFSTEIGVANSAELPDKLKYDGMSSVVNIDGTDYYATSAVTSDMTVISATPIHDMYSYFFSHLCIFILGFIVLLVNFSTLCLYEPSDELQTESDVHTLADTIHHEEFYDIVNSNKINPNSILDVDFRKGIVGLFIVVAVSFILLLFSVVDRGTLIGFMFSDKWTKGLNVFSITTTAIVACLTFLGVRLIRAIIRILGSNLGSRASTVCAMSSSIVSFLALFAVIGYGLYQCGVDPTALLIGAGITGTIIGIGAQSTINDIISGLFLVFEGKIHVGDWIKLGDFRGEVIDIGARVTTVKLYNWVKVFNNSTIRDFINLSTTLASAYIEIPLHLNADVKKVGEIIENNKEFYLERIPNMINGPFFLGTSSCEDGILYVALIIKVPEAQRISTERKALEATIDLLNSNGIELVDPYKYFKYTFRKED